MIQKIQNKLNKNTLLKVLSINSLAVFVRVITGFFTTKIIAILIGPSGLPLISNLTNFLNSSKNIATLGMQEAVIAQIASVNNDDELLKKRISTGFFVMLFSAILVALTVFFGASYYARILFNAVNYLNLIRILAVLIPFLAIYVFLIAVINGFKRYKKVILINVLTTVLSFIVSVSLIYKMQLFGALLALLTAQLISFALLFTAAKEIKEIIQKIHFHYFDKNVLKSYATYGLMALVTALTVPWVFILVRNEITLQLGLEQAGYWDAMMRISNFYLLFVGSALSLYYLPTLAALKTDKSFFKEVKNYYKTVMPIMFIGLIVVYFSRNIIIALFLTKSFSAVSELFLYQLAADFFKVASLAFTYQFLAKKMLWQYVFTELFFVIVFYFLAHYFLSLNALTGVVKAYLCSYILYYGVVLILFRKSIFGYKG